MVLMKWLSIEMKYFFLEYKKFEIIVYQFNIVSKIRDISGTVWTFQKLF